MNRRRFICELDAPADLGTDQLAKALESLGVKARAVKQPGTNCRAKRVEMADVIPMHRARRWPGVVPDGAA